MLGYIHHTEKLAENEFHVWFYRTEEKEPEGSAPYRPLALLNYPMIDEDLGRIAADFWQATWQSEKRTLPYEMRLLLSLTNAVVAQVRVPAGTHSTIVFPFTGPNGQHNYSNFAGFSIPWRIPGAGKITIGIGRGSKTTRSDLTQGSYSIIPGNNLAHNSGEILDITFDNVRDATRGGYVVKVREIYALSEAAGWRVKTTTS